MRSRRLWLGALVSLSLVAFLLVRTDLKAMLHTLRDANYLFLLPATVLYFGNAALRTHRWQFLLKRLKPVSVLRLYPVVVVGNMANTLLPFRLGEAARSYFLSRREGIAVTSGLATIVVERIADGLTLICLLAPTLLLFPLGGVFRDSADGSRAQWAVLLLVVVGASLCAFGALLVAASSPRITTAWRVKAGSWLPRSVGPRLVEVASKFFEGLAPLRSLRSFMILLALSVPIWIVEASMYFMIGLSFGLPSHLSNVSGPGSIAMAFLATMAIANLALLIPSFQGGLGVFDVAVVATLTALGVPASIGTPYAVTVHAILLVPMTVAGLIVVWRGDVALSKLVDRRLAGGPS